MNSLLINRVKENLEHFNLWTSVTIHLYDECKINFLSGIPPTKLNIKDIDGLTEWIVPLNFEKKLITVNEVDRWFNEIGKINFKNSESKRPKRLTIAIVDNDGTISYYFVHDGLIKTNTY